MNHDTTQPEEDASESNPGEHLSEQLSGGEESYIVEDTPKANNQGTLLLTLLLVAAGAGGWWWFKSGPASATAAPAPEVQAADETINQFLTHDNENLKVMRRMFDSTQQFVEQFKSYPSMKQVPLSDLHTNPFRFSQAAGQETDEQLKQQREMQRQEALQSVQDLSLQSILVSDSHSACMINNHMYQEGEQVDSSFLVERISTNSVIVRKGPYRFELKMAR